MPRASSDTPPSPWAWIVTWWGWAVGGAVVDHHHPAPPSYLAAGLLAGALWQLISRRDLTARLTPLAAAAVTLFLFVLITVDSPVWADTNDLTTYWFGVVVALVLVEQGHRWHDRQVARRTAAPANDAVADQVDSH